MEEPDTLEDHSRTIIHIDIDCFYAQVETIKNPKLQFVPLGVVQKNLIVTTNYIARNLGVSKSGFVDQILTQYPKLVIVNGEDLHDYRQKSYEVTALLQQYSNLVERSGLDENFIDISELVAEKLESASNLSTYGHTFGDIGDLCGCGCTIRLQIGTMICQEMRDKIKSDLKLTTSAGVAHNKLLAKIVGKTHKPDQQTVIFPNNAVELMLSLTTVSKIPSIGHALSEQLGTINITTVRNLHETNLSVLSNLLGSEKAKVIQRMSFGIDNTPVKSSGKPQTIGIEDSCEILTAEKEVKEKLGQLLNRIIILVLEDGRLPKTLKLTIRKFHKEKKRKNTRESKQCNVNPSWFTSNDKTKLSDTAMKKIMTAIMQLFNKLVDTKKPYHLTLVGLAFTKFLEKPSPANVLTNFIKKDIEVQSITNIQNNISSSNSNKVMPSTLIIPPENDFEPPAKKYKVSDVHLESPTDLSIEDLHLNSEVDICGSNRKEISEESAANVEGRMEIKCPPNVDCSVFQELPSDVQRELWEEYKKNRPVDRNFENKRLKSNTLLNYFGKKV